MKSQNCYIWKKRTSQFVIILAVLLAFVLAGCSSLRTIRQTGCYKREGLDPGIEVVIDEFRPSVTEIMKDTKMVGAAIAPVDTEGVLWTEGFGYTDRKRHTPVTPDTPFLVNCMGKTFTATAVMIAVQDGLLDLDEPITIYLPDFKLYSRYEENPEKKITLTHLLSQRSRLFREPTIGNMFESSAEASFEEHIRSLYVTHLDISLKTDFQSNNVYTVVKASVENFSENTVQTAEFRLCSTGNDRDFGADVKHIYLLEDNGKKDLQFTIRKIEDAYQNANEWEIYQVAFPKPVRPGQRCSLQFEYTMTGKPDHSSAPILQSAQGLKEIYLRGGDYFWCPTPYFERKPHASIRLCQPSWTLRMECPARYVVVTDGELRRREDKGGLVKDEWKSLIPGTPRLYVGQYKVVSRTADGMTFEMYAPDQNRLTKAAVKLEKYARMYRMYSELYGDPGYRVYRIVGSAVAGGGASFITGQMIQMGRLEDTHYIAYEMAHTWWGFLISASGGGYKFLSEAMAEFSARWILRVMSEEDEYRSLSDDCILGWKQRHFCLFFPLSDYTRTYVPLIHQEGYDRKLVTEWNYCWGPLVANQIRLILGDEVFFRCLKAFVSKYRGKQVHIDDFVQTINAVSQRDMTSELKGLLWSAGYASYRLAGFVCEKADGGYRTKVRIHNEGQYGLTCPLLLKTIGGEKRTVFKVEGKQEKEFVFSTEYEVVDVLIDPDLTVLQYHPEKKVRLWTAIRITGTNECYGKSYVYYALGEHRKAVEMISQRLHDRMMLKKENSIDGLLKKDGYYAPYVFMRAVFYLGLDDVLHAEQDVKSAFPYMLAALQSGKSVSVPRTYYEVGAIKQKNLGAYLSLLKLIAAREFSLETGLDDAAKKTKVEEWKQWWEKEGKHRKLDLSALRDRFQNRQK